MHKPWRLFDFQRIFYAHFTFNGGIGQTEYKCLFLKKYAIFFFAAYNEWKKNFVIITQCMRIYGFSKKKITFVVCFIPGNNDWITYKMHWTRYTLSLWINIQYLPRKIMAAFCVRKLLLYCLLSLLLHFNCDALKKNSIYKNRLTTINFS